ncbi:MAG: hypothetical protein LUH07_07780 [Lachnospiraceae bacterium]|nr:hypothetical protein [Lachnospiraceae bacterium]
MTSFAGSMILVLLSFAVLVFLIMKGVALLPSALAAGCVLAFAVDRGWINGLFTLFSEAAGSYAASLLIPFMAGGVFGAIMIATGSDIVIGRTIINKFGTGFAIYALALFVAIMGAAGISSWPYLAAIFAFALMRASNLPIKIACVTMVGINSAFSFILAGLPTLPNILASQAFGTTLYASMGLSVVMCAVQCAGASVC